MKICSATWSTGRCDRRFFSDGLCHAHHLQRRRGKAEFTPIRFYRPIGMEGPELAKWCVEHATAAGPGACRTWIFATRNGYPVMTLPDGTSHKSGSHRFIAEHLVAKRPLTAADVVHHRCAVRQCINPDHLQITTSAANTAEMFDRNKLLARIAELEKTLEENGIAA